MTDNIILFYMIFFHTTGGKNYYFNVYIMSDYSCIVKTHSTQSFTLSL